MNTKTYSKEQIGAAVQKSKSIAGVCRELGLQAKGSNYETVKRYMSEYNIDDSHFTGARWNKDIKYVNATALHSLEEVTQRGIVYKSDTLKKRLIAEGIKEYKCEICGLTEWNGQPIPIELHHINGDHNDNRIENLQILCRNCHAQTDSFCKKKSAREKSQLSSGTTLESHEHICTCKQCGKIFKSGRDRSFCSRDCYNKYVRKTTELKLFTKENIEEALIKYHTISDLAIYFNTSRPTIRKYLVRFELKDKLDTGAQLHVKAVNQYDKDDNFIKQWPSMSDAERTLKINGVGDCCLGKQASCGGFKWKYV